NQLNDLLNDLIESNSIILLTGFLVKSHLIGETDGPPGALILANALKLLDKDVVIITDKYSKNLLLEGKKSIDKDFEIEILKKSDEDSQIDCFFKKYNPDHILSIERPGKNFNDKYYSMNKVNLTKYIPNTDIFFEKAKKLDVLTSAIGDGGNELGMGKIKEYVFKNIQNGKTIAANLACDNLLVTTVSNWGAYGLVAGLSIDYGKNLFLDVKKYQEIIKNMVKIGAVDGYSLKNELSIDGFSFKECIKVYNQLNLIVKNNK
ncbi:MAG: DUF4392 domain-containing protein, partial [Bacillota bacterium]